MTEVAVTAFRNLAHTHPATHRSDLAKALSNYGSILQRLQRNEEALPALEEAAALTSELAATGGPGHHPELARTYLNLTLSLSDAGQRTAALAAAESAASLYENLAATNSGEEPGRAQAWRLVSELLPPEEATRAMGLARAATDTYRRLALAHPKAHRLELARAQLSLSMRLHEAGKDRRARQLADAAVTIFRETAGSAPRQHGPELANALEHLAACQGARRPQQMLKALAEAVAVNQPLVEADPFRHAARTARTGALYSIALSENGKEKEALFIAEELVKAQQDTAAIEYTTRNVHGLACALYALAIARCNAGKALLDALPPLTASRDLYRDLAAEDPREYTAGYRFAENAHAKLLREIWGKPSRTSLILTVDGTEMVIPVPRKRSYRFGKARFRHPR